MRILSPLLVCLLVPPGLSAQDKDKDKDKEPGDWELLHKYIELALPRFDGRNLTTLTRFDLDARKAYYDEDAKEAARLEVRTIKGLEEGIAAFVKTHILRIRLTGISALETDDFSTFLKTLSTPPVGLSPDEKKLLEGLAKGDAAKIAKRGWLIEVRGYTYHTKGVDFIRDSLVENIALLNDAIDISSEMKSTIQDRISFVMLYQVQKVNDGADADSPLHKRPLKTLADGGKLGKAKVIDKVVFKDAMPPTKADPAVRTDFSLLFFWRAVEAAPK